MIVDLRKGSQPTSNGKVISYPQSNHRQLLVPRGFAHGFLTLTDNVNFVYKCDNYYDAEADGEFPLRRRN